MAWTKEGETGESCGQIIEQLPPEGSAVGDRRGRFAYGYGAEYLLAQPRAQQTFISGEGGIPSERCTPMPTCPYSMSPAARGGWLRYSRITCEGWLLRAA